VRPAEYLRVGRGGKGGREVDPGLLQPIFDYKGRPFKVVKFAADITKAVKDRVRKASIQPALDVDIGQITEAIANTIRVASRHHGCNHPRASIGSTTRER